MYQYEQKHLEIMRALAPECTVLLKKDGCFPLSAPGSIALYGSGARQTIKGGTGSGDVNSRFYYTAEHGLEAAGFTITSKAWLDSYDAIRAGAKKQFIADIKKEARKKHTLAIMLGMGAVMPEPEYTLPLDGEGDTALYILGRISGEGNDRKAAEGDLKLTGTEIRDILACSRRYQNFMLVLNVGGVVDLTPVNEVGNILVLSQLGAVTGQALADIVLGTANPSGKLTTTWAAAEDYPAIGTFGDSDDTYYNDGIYVGYRYFDSADKAALYPFGYGLSYTEFALSGAAAALQGTKLTVSVEVGNTGSIAGKQVVQVYVSVPWGKLDQPRKTLAGFAKTGLIAPGERETVTVSFGLESIASYDADTARYILEAGSYIIRVGTDSRTTTACAAVKLAETVTVRQLTNVGGKPDFTDWVPVQCPAEDCSGLPVLEADCAAFAALPLPKPFVSGEKAAAKAKSCTDEELIHLCMGYFNETAKGLTDVIGEASCTVAGAAGESTSAVAGVPNLVMADGPAGLRLAKTFYTDSKGVHAIGDSLPAGMADFMPGIVKFFMKHMAKKPVGEIREQYCTAIPIGTALAQSWNTALCETCGDVVGDEMERFGVDLWLAPAFNIHRSVLCGRNFEYYSEDPLLSGLVAAAITNGVQKHPGRGTTVKHFCCNNQETNRYCSNSHVSERALRETYTRAFKICIEESRPLALMTSYNLLNGVHTSERSDLMRTLLREEWGYDGLIMTDWVISAMNAKGKYRMAQPAPTIACGNDVFMPGGARDYKQALSALKGTHKEYTITREQAEYAAAHMIETAWRMKGEK